MEIWPLILYVAASLFALRSLISLMTQHKRIYTQQLIAEEVARRHAEQTAGSDDAENNGESQEQQPPESSPVPASAGLVQRTATNQSDAA